MSEDAHKVDGMTDAPQAKTAFVINDGPEYQPNFKRRVVVVGESHMPGFVKCLDIDRRELVTVDKGRLERAEKVEIPV